MQAKPNPARGLEMNDRPLRLSSFHRSLKRTVFCRFIRNCKKPLGLRPILESNVGIPSEANRIAIIVECLVCHLENTNAST